MRWIGVGVAAALLVLGCRSKESDKAASEAAGEATSACSAAGLRVGVEAVTRATAAQRTVLAAQALAEACPKPEALAVAVKQVGQLAPGEMTKVIVAKAVTAQQGLWSKACTGGTAVFERLATAGLDERTGLLWRDCGVDRFGFATAAEITDQELILPAILYAELLQGPRGLPADGRALLRAVVGAP